MLSVVAPEFDGNNADYTLAGENRKNLKWRRDTQHNNTQHNDTQHNDTQHNTTQQNNIQHTNK